MRVELAWSNWIYATHDKSENGVVPLIKAGQEICNEFVVTQGVPDAARSSAY
jgi:hypothetical protein